MPPEQSDTTIKLKNESLQEIFEDIVSRIQLTV